MIGHLFGRLDLAVAVFFSLSGFLLWRPHAAAARGLAPAPPVRRYLLHRAARILPAYWVVVTVVLLLLPEAGGGLRVWVANLTLVQVFVPLTLTQGMTQMWSLSVEIAFYLLLPFIGLAMAGLRGHRARWRVTLVTVVCVLSLGWTYLPVPTEDGVNIENWLPGYLPWFGVGMVIAEWAVQTSTQGRAVNPPGRLAAAVIRTADHRRLLLLAAAVCFALSATELAGPRGLVTPEPWQFAVRIALGAVIAFALIAPLVLGAAVRAPWLSSPLALTLGRWSYGLFMWHLAVLAVVFPVFGITPFSGGFVEVTLLTLVLSIPVAAASYALIEEPVRSAVRRVDSTRRTSGDTHPHAAATPTADNDSSAKS